MQLGRDVADLFVQQAVDQRVHVLVGGGRLLAGGEPRADGVEAALERLLSSSVSTPACQSATAHALDKRMSNGQRRKSTPMELLSASNSGAGPPAKRPPHSLCVVLDAAETRGRRHAICSAGRAGTASSSSRRASRPALRARAPSPDP